MSLAYLMMMVLGGDTVRGVKGVEFGAETAVAWGSCLDFELSRRPILTTCGLSVGMPRSDSFLFSLPLWIMFEAEL